MNLHGPVSGPVLACATGLAAIGEAARRIVYGQAEVMLAGAADSILTPLAFVGFGRIGALSSRNETPQRAVTPFDATRDGPVIGEGGAVVVLESLAHAEARGATILAEVLGYGLSADGYHLAAPEPSGRGAAHAMRLALADADLAPADIDYIAAHGTGTVLNDAAETQAVKAVFGADSPPPLSSLKGMTGHLMGASGSLACVATVNAIQAGQVPPTIGWQVPDPACDLDYIPHQSRPLSVQRAMVNAFGFGGQNASLVIAKH
jgi:3-oxoacyl-[acyl-carrier-protein] synthase II